MHEFFAVFQELGKEACSTFFEKTLNKPEIDIDSWSFRSCCVMLSGQKDFQILTADKNDCLKRCDRVGVTLKIFEL